MSKKFTKKLQKSISMMVMVTTIVWMSGIAMITPVFIEKVNADEFTNDVSVSDITSTSPKIAANGESALAVLGIDATRVDTTDNIELNGVKVVLNSDDSAEEAVIANIETVDIYVDSNSTSGTSGVYDSTDSLIRSVTRTESGATSTTVASDYAAGVTVIAVAAAAGIVTGDYIKIGTGATAEVRAATVAVNDITVAATTYAHVTGEVVREINNEVSAGAEGFTAYSAETTLTIGTFGSADANVNWNVLKTNSGNTLGDDLFIRLTTANGTDNQTIKAKVVPGGVQYWNVTTTAAVSVTGNSTDNETKSIIFGTDGVAPTISKVETYDNNTNGKVDRVKVYFSESMASTVTSTNNFKDALAGGDHEINTTTGTDIDLNTTGTWSTTTVLNDTFTIDFANESAPYYGAANSTGDTWTVIYDEDGGDDIADATGTLLADKSITTTDMARPYLVTDDNTTKHDIDGDGQIDEIRVKFSETLGDSTSTGFTLRNTTTSTDYTLGAVNGYATSVTDSNSNDTIKIAVTESGSTDLNDTYTLSYAEGSTIYDAAGNEAVSRSGITPVLAANPIITKIEIKDNDADGKIDRAEVTFSCDITEVNNAYTDFAVAGYAAPTAGAASGKVYTLTITEGSLYDTDATPDVTYINDGDTHYLHCGDTNFPLENVVADTVVEADKASPILLTAKLYESDDDDIWDSGETVQLFFSEGIDPSSIATSWSGDAFGDFTDNLDAADRPDSGTMEINGKVVVLTASENATTAMTTSDYIRPLTNEVKDSAGNSAPATSVVLIVSPTTAPTVDQINTLDENNNGVVDALAINFNGIIDASTIVASDFAAARGSNFSIDSSELATSTNAVSPDLTINEVVTQNGGNDSAVIVRFTEVGEDTGAHPQVKYVKGTLSDLAANEVATFNAYSSDNTKFEADITSDTKDKVAPKVMEIRLKDRNSNNKCDQLMITYSELIKNDAGTLVNGVLSSTGWAIADHTIAASGSVYDNTNMALTYATTNAVFKVDINEVSGNEGPLPEVTFSGSGVTKDAWNNPLAAVAEGDIAELTECTHTDAIVDGDVARIGAAPEVYIIKIVGSNKYKRHIVSPEVFNSYGHLSWDAIKSVSSLDDYSLSAWVRSNTGPNETPAATDKVYEVNADSTMHWLNMTAVQFYARGGSDEAIYNVNDGELGLYTLGVDVMYQ